jgi:hypothetical protein
MPGRATREQANPRCNGNHSSAISVRSSTWPDREVSRLTVSHPPTNSLLRYHTFAPNSTRVGHGAFDWGFLW